MNFKQKNAQIFIPNKLPLLQALENTTYMAIGAHQDDIELIASGPITECYNNKNKKFAGIVVTDGSGSPRSGKYKNITDEQMREIRNTEQKKAAKIGKYCAQIFLDYPSKDIKDSLNKNPVTDLVNILKIAKPEIIYTHNLADKHDTHVAVALRVIEAIRLLPINLRPKALYGVEIWRSLDWLSDNDKILINTSENKKLQKSLISVFKSQILGGKRYDTAILGRQKANATFFSSHNIDKFTDIAFAMNLTKLITDTKLDPKILIQEYLDSFYQDVINRLDKLK